MGHLKDSSVFLLIIFVFSIHVFSLVEANSNHHHNGVYDKKTTRSSTGSFLHLFHNCLVRLSTSDKLDSMVTLATVTRYSKYFNDKTSVLLETIKRTSNDSFSIPKNRKSREEWNSNQQNGMDQENVSSKLKWTMLRKNLACFVQIYFVDEIVGETGDFFWMHKILDKMVSNDENPSYIIFIKNHAKKERKSATFIDSEKGFYSNLYRLTLTSKFVVIDSQRKEVKLVCMHCRGTIENQLKLIDPKKHMGSLQTLNRFWHHIHQNLQGRSVEGISAKGTALDELKAFQDHQCGMYKAGLNIVENICAQLAISKNLNFTPFTTTRDYRVYGQIKSGALSYSGYNDELFLKSSSTAKYEWATAGEHFEPFIYITVVNKDALNISAMYRVFDFETWMIIIVVFVVLAGLFGTMTSSKFDVSSFPFFIAILLEQSQLTIWKVKMRIDMLSKIILVVWISVSIIISSLYKGTIYSYLCTSIPPPIPPTTKALVESSYFLLTTTSYYWQGRPYSTLDGILKEMTVGQVGRDYPLFYKELKENVHFVPVDHSEIVKAHRASSQLLVINRRHESNYDATGTPYKDNELVVQNTANHKYLPYVQNVTLPENFAIIGSQFDVETLMKLLETFTTSFVLKSSTVHIFLNRMPFIIRRNFFFNKFQPELSYLYESGIYENWRKMHETSFVVKEFANVHQAVGGIGQQHYNYLALLFSGINIVERHHTLLPKPLSFEVFDSALVFYVLCSAASMGVFMTEWFFLIFSKIFLKVERNMVGHQRI